MLTSSPPNLSQLALLFLKIGIIGFGGPAAHIALMEEEVVKRRAWMTKERFLDLVGATNLIPGPNSTEMAIHIGYIFGGLAGLIITGVCFITPAVLITGFLAWIYTNYGTLPDVAPIFAWIKPVVIAVIFQALWRLGKKALKTRQLLFIGLGVIGLLILGLNEVIALLLGGRGFSAGERMVNPATIIRCYCCGSIYPRSSVIHSHFYRLSNIRSIGGNCGDSSDFLSFFYLCFIT